MIYQNICKETRQSEFPCRQVQYHKTFYFRQEGKYVPNSPLLQKFIFQHRVNYECAADLDGHSGRKN